jgi:hypothetical protein
MGEGKVGSEGRGGMGLGVHVRDLGVQGAGRRGEGERETWESDLMLGFLQD